MSVKSFTIETVVVDIIQHTTKNLSDIIVKIVLELKMGKLINLQIN